MADGNTAHRQLLARQESMHRIALGKDRSGPTQNGGRDDSHLLRGSMVQSQEVLSTYPAAHRGGPQIPPALTSGGGSYPDNFHRSIKLT